MNIKSMLLRLQTALNRDGLVEELILSNGLLNPDSSASPNADTINMVVGYNSSPNSHAALDLTLWIAHQTRLATRRQVVVQVVYVQEDATWSRLNDDVQQGDFHRGAYHRDEFHLGPVSHPGGSAAKGLTRFTPTQATHSGEGRERLWERSRLEPARDSASCALLPAESVELFSYADQVPI